MDQGRTLWTDLTDLGRRFKEVDRQLSDLSRQHPNVDSTLKQDWALFEAEKELEKLPSFIQQYILLRRGHYIRAGEAIIAMLREDNLYGWWWTTPRRRALACSRAVVATWRVVTLIPCGR